MFQAIVGLLSTSHILLVKVRLLHINLLLDRYFQFDHCVYCEYLSTPICPDQIGPHPNSVTSILKFNEKRVVANYFWEWSKLSVKVFCVVVFLCWKCCVNRLQNFISLNIGLFHLLPTDNR